METTVKSVHVVAFIDIGTNAVRLLVVRINPNLSYTIVSQEKEVVRLGEEEFKDNILKPEAMSRAIFVCKKFVDLAKTYGASQIIAVGTSAIREASNQLEFLVDLHIQTGLKVKVISGQEEAKLVCLGVSSGIDIGDKKAIFIDLGGGSIEIAIGNAYEIFYLNSLKIGAIRLTAQFIGEGWIGPITSNVYKQIKNYAGIKVHAVKTLVLQYGARLAWGSSGTMINLAEISSKLFKKNGNENGNLTLTRKNLKKLAPILCSLSLEERRKLPAINPERADIIIAGAAVVEAIMEEFGLEEIHISHRELRDGLLFEYLSNFEGFRELQKTPMRERSVLQLGRSCNFDEKHAATVASLSLQLFDSAKKIGLHNLGQNEKELLKYAATLHDVGDFLSFSNHHLHSDYIISNAGLLGFDRCEIDMMACIAHFHRKKLPSRKYLRNRGFDDKKRETVIALSTFVRFSEKLDRSHSALVKKAELIAENKDAVLLMFLSESDCSFEKWSIIQNKQAFSEAFDKELDVHCEVNQGIG